MKSRCVFTIVATLVWTTLLPAIARAEEEPAFLRTSEMSAPFREEARAEWEDIKTGMLSSFRVPLKELLVKKSDSPVQNLLQGWSATTGFSQPFTRLRIEREGAGQQGTRSGSAPTISQTLSYTPLGSWKGSISFIYRITHESSQPWEGDFVYSFGYSDWRPYTFSLTYSNFGGNKFRPQGGRRASAFEQGSIYFGWKFPIHPSVFRYFALTESSSMGCNVGYSLTPVWSGLNTDGTENLKHRVGFGCKYNVWRSWFVTANVNWFPDSRQQQPWDPDFTYGFGYFDWHPGTFSFQYANFSGNRFPWSKKPTTTGKFKHGSFGISYSWKF